MDKISVLVFAVIGVFVVACGLGLLMAFPIKWCWNATMPYLLSLPTITWGKAWCLSFLSSCLLKSHNISTNSK